MRTVLFKLIATGTLLVATQGCSEAGPAAPTVPARAAAARTAGAAAPSASAPSGPSTAPAPGSGPAAMPTATSPATATAANTATANPPAAVDAGSPSAMADAGASPLPGSVEQQVMVLVEMSKNQTVIDSSVIMPLYEKLQPVTVDFMVSVWHGSVFSGSPNGWWGKNMSDPTDVQPMLFSNADGSVYANESYGRASLTMGVWNGLSSTVALVYKSLPITDYFRKVTDQTVIGLTPPSFFFQLTRDNTTKVQGAVGPTK